MVGELINIRGKRLYVEHAGYKRSFETGVKAE